MKKTDTLPATLSALIQEYSIAEGIQMAEQQVRENPAKALCRHSLFQLLCVAGDWSRALHQLQLCARMEANYTQEARLYRELVRCEMFRRTVFQGEQRPGFLLPQPVWVESLLAALAWNVFHGHNLLHEFFACPERFYFFTPTGLSAGLQKVQGNVAEIVILLNRLPPDWLIHQTDAAQFSLFCTPVINLFPRTTTRIEVTHSVTEQHLVVDRTRPLDYEVFSVQEVEGLEAETTRKMIFRPLYHTRNNDEGNHGRYFSLRREPRRSSENARRYGTRTPYTGSEVFLSLVDQHEAPYPENLRHITVTAMVTNRDLPCLIPRNGRDDLTVDAAIPVAGVGLIRPPRPPQPPLAEREMAWRLIRQLSFNYLPLADLDHRTGGQALRDLLNLFIPAHDSPQSRQVRSLIGCKTTPVTRRLPGSGLLVYGRGVSCELTVDEEGFSGISPYLFGLVLEHYIARHVSINTFSQMTLHSMQRGHVMTWPVRTGQRGSV
ncbi:type VI secretion system baseplate subunit TssF [Salmonella enterica]|nr:type VI secretion system baseplate subunit TssF [Salmonella enterica]EBY4402005.1 type VI secretion system baseplate subunit TssF [Salmonella enterica subsp. enterica serovar Caracas]EEL2513400.1 type VI secretion system baseplate subunit TssF [Salmonella enterica]EGK0773790.1 type VI secretion system baseplate subunit TssF [Salmonella enterica]EGO0706128.1 type VI secretion system baseplate subunit TssF [Salmonella enterica]